MKKTVIGIMADVDAGKTTLSESMLYLSGAVRRPGRVDNGDAFLDTHSLEKKRGITIFSKQAVFSFGDTAFTLLDTPGHADFTAETERALAVLDYAILLINGSDGVAGHTETLWRLLKSRNIPTFIFVNKMDLAGTDKSSLLDDMHRRLGADIVDFTLPQEQRDENSAMCDELLLEAYDENLRLGDCELAYAVRRRTIFPCLFGSALRSNGTEDLLNMLDKLTLEKCYSDKFAAQVYKIERDSAGKRMTCMKITGGSLKVRDTMRYSPKGKNEPTDQIEEKINQIRIYSGGKFTSADEVSAGDVCAVTGLTASYAGQGLGGQSDISETLVEPVMTYRIQPPESCDNFTLHSRLCELMEEDPELHVRYSEQLDEITVQLMGEIQTEILKSIIYDRFGLDVTIGSGRILYRETIAESVEGVGHYEPLRHYAEVHLILTPLPQGSGIRFESDLSEDILSRNWQNLIISSLQSKTHIGVLTGSPITDIKITLSAGKAHLKHTEGGDFREAAWRAVRHALMKAENILLEPYYSFSITIPSECIGRAISDIQNMHGEFTQPDTQDETAFITGCAPVSLMRNYSAKLTEYTRGRGSISLMPDGYRPCHNPAEVITSAAYDPEADLDNCADSVFCSHGAGYVVHWTEVEHHMHLEPTLISGKAAQPVKKRNYSISEEELERIMNKIAPKKEIIQNDKGKVREEIRKNAVFKAKPETRPRLLIVDGYNIVFAWEDLRALAAANIDAACDKLADILENYAAFRSIPLILVFDAYKTPAVTPHTIKADRIEIVYTKSGQTSDAFIESFCNTNRKKYRIRVATNDSLVRLSVMSVGALRMSARELKTDVDSANKLIEELIRRNNT